MSRPLRLCLVGATGLTGMELIREAVGRRDIRVIGVTRREVALPRGARMEMLLAPVEGWADAIAAANASVLVCALGTTWAKAQKDEAAFTAVDKDLVIACARAAKEAGIKRMIVVSSAGADMLSRNRYLRVKGEMEEAVAKVGLARLDILRPGLLRGPRAESRPLERLGMLASPLTDLLMQGKYREYRSVKVRTLVHAIIGLAKEKAGGRFVHGHDAIVRAARRGINPEGD